MYMPGRRRTGSRPSSTVMSLAEYSAFAVVFAITKKSCKTSVLRDDGSLSDGPVAARPGEAETERFLHTFAQVFVADSGREKARLPHVLGPRRDRRRRRLGIGLRQGSRREAKRPHLE